MVINNISLKSLIDRYSKLENDVKLSALKDTINQINAYGSGFLIGRLITVILTYYLSGFEFAIIAFVILFSYNLYQVANCKRLEQELESQNPNPEVIENGLIFQVVFRMLTFGIVNIIFNLNVTQLSIIASTFFICAHSYILIAQAAANPRVLISGISVLSITIIVNGLILSLDSNSILPVAICGFYSYILFIICALAINQSHRSHELRNDLADNIIQLNEYIRTLEKEKSHIESLELIAGVGNYTWIFENGQHIWSRGIYNVLGRKNPNFTPSREEFLSRLIEEDRARYIQLAREAKNNNKPFDIEFSTIADDGSIRHVALHGQSIFDDEGKMIGMKGIVIDQTAIQNSLNEAKRANRVKSEFLANMSHEIRTPLNGVLAIAGILGKSELKPEQHEMVKVIEKSGETLNELLKDILDLARVESGKIEIINAEFNLKDALQSTAAIFANKANDKGIEYNVNIDENANCAFIGDETRIKQIVANFLSNAVKFTNSGNVTLEAKIAKARGKKDCEKWEISIKDSGKGIAKADIAKLFERFEQVDGSMTRQYGGTGLGLAISNGLAKLMDGKIKVKSVLNKGSVFTLILNLRKTNSKNATNILVDEFEMASLENEECLNILAVDDNETNRRILELILRPLGVNLVLCCNGQEGYDAFARQKFDIVLMDLQMPVMDGLTAMREIRRLERQINAKKIPIIAISANAMMHQVEEAKQAGANMHIAKPFTPQCLINGIEAMLSEGDEQEAIAS